jgi:molecular chaperone GrpE
MSDAGLPDEPWPPLLVVREADVEPEVALVVPAAAYDSIATDDELTLRDEHPSERAPDPFDPRILDAIGTLGDALSRKLDALQTVFDREIRAEATREKVVDRLHAELQEYKQDMLLNVLRPVFVDLIQLHDDIGKMVASHQSAEGDIRRLADTMAGFQQGIEDILYRQGVEPFVLDGTAFDPKRQRAVATVPTEDPALNKSIAVRHRKGFCAGEKVIRPEIVSVFAVRKV